MPLISNHGPDADPRKSVMLAKQPATLCLKHATGSVSDGDES